MKKKVIAIAVAFAALLVPTVANAGERVLDGALGAASGGLLAGPGGFIAGGIIGYAAGPEIARSLGFHRRYRPYYYYYGHRVYGACYARTPYGYQWVCD
jgi:hypothetical protein